MRPTASDTFHDSPYYRREIFRTGLERVGYAVGQGPKPYPRPDDVLLVWNRSAHNDHFARRYEATGARVIVAENGYIGRDHHGQMLYALAIGQHNGAGRWREGDAERWSRLGVDIAPWRRNGGDIVLLPQRGIGAPGIAMPKNWLADVTDRLRKVTDRRIRVRLHPGKSKTDPLPELHGAWAAVTWGSGAGIKSIIYGIPVFHELETWIGAPAARFGIESIETPFVGDRLPMLQRLAWAQWSLQEIGSGEAFRWLLS